jgi:small subunit ribosomal protein S16
MLKIRLQKVGKKNSPSFRVVLVEHTFRPQGKFIELLGSYNKVQKQKSFNKDRILYWISKGAQVSPTMHNLLIDEKILEGAKVKAWKPKKRPASAEASAGKAEAQVKAETPVETPAETVVEVPSEVPSTETKEEEKKEKAPIDNSGPKE